MGIAELFLGTVIVGLFVRCYHDRKRYESLVASGKVERVGALVIGSKIEINGDVLMAKPSYVGPAIISIVAVLVYGAFRILAS